MPTEKQITVYVEAVNPSAPNFGDTNIVIPETDPDRADFLMSCRTFFLDQERPADAQKFYDAVKQTPSTPES